MKKFIITTISMFPLFSFAASGNIKSIADSVTKFLTSLVMPMLFSIALAWFIWGVADFIRGAENSEERKRGKQRMLWGIIALVVMVTFLSLTSVVTTSLFNKGPILPQLF